MNDLLSRLSKYLFLNWNQLFGTVYIRMRELLYSTIPLALETEI